MKSIQDLISGFSKAATDNGINVDGAGATLYKGYLYSKTTSSGRFGARAGSTSTRNLYDESGAYLVADKDHTLTPRYVRGVDGSLLYNFADVPEGVTYEMSASGTLEMLRFTNHSDSDLYVQDACYIEYEVS